MWKRKKPPQRSTAEVLEDLPHDAEALRELQRVIQLEKVDQWMGQMQQEQRRTRRVSNFFRFGLLTLFAAGVANTSYLICAQKITLKYRLITYRDF
ncbi:hypothetical protein [Vreelandella massiliensis]|uniref:hypothetical protein n=1 Tax=Vreelandella massiliensis TaxID=1816686 RepID=UPI00096A3308|nr:hypothetical protein [Halomonas massiliensis]